MNKFMFTYIFVVVVNTRWLMIMTISFREYARNSFILFSGKFKNLKTKYST